MEGLVEKGRMFRENFITATSPSLLQGNTREIFSAFHYENLVVLMEVKHRLWFYPRLSLLTVSNSQTCPY